MRLRVSPGSSRDRILGTHAGALKLAVSAAPEKGRANRDAARLVASLFGLPTRDVVLIAGEASRDKVVRLALSFEQVSQRWNDARDRSVAAKREPRRRLRAP